MFVVIKTIYVKNGSRFSVGSIDTMSNYPRFPGTPQVAKDCILVWGWEDVVHTVGFVW